VPVTPEPTVIVRPNLLPCELPHWPRPISLNEQPLKGGSSAVRSDGSTIAVADGSVIVPREGLAEIARYVTATTAYLDSNMLCIEGHQ
jgi:hypothetical protein